MGTVKITYNNNITQTGSLSDWSRLRSDGVQTILVTVNGLSAFRHASSIYWVYEENENWVLGSGSVRYDPNEISEILINKVHGNQIERKRSFMPDLTIDKVKLGWWNFG